MIKVDDLTVEYEGGVVALRNVSLEAGPGEITVLSGPNGGGKSTLLRVISGVIPHYIKARVEGRVRVDSVDPLRDPHGLKRILQATQQDPTAQVVGPTVYSEAALTPSLWGLPPGEVRERALEALETHGILHLRERPVHRLSSGELMRTALAGVTSVKPRYLLLDEPTSHLDEKGVDSFLESITRLREEGMGIVIASHNPRIHRIADKCYTIKVELREGCIEGPPLPERKRVPQGVTRGEPVITLESVSASYPGAEEPALRDASLRIHRGEMVSLVGPNGSGKTTLLYTIAGILKPSRGTVRVAEKPALLPPDPLLVFSRGTLRDELKALNTEWVPDWASGLVDKPLLRMSGGELKLASLALVAASGRRLLLLDEPTEGLDPWNRARLAEALMDLAEKGYTVVYATHDRGLAGLADRVFRVSGGVVYA
ncbi:MAG: ATP-binding cassette domain-containing protein [Desulfurococcales archaeon]|nr:ATP-binding cassette domain-containing protein [Desulfurococcales archaeon]